MEPFSTSRCVLRRAVAVLAVSMVVFVAGGAVPGASSANRSTGGVITTQDDVLPLPATVSTARPSTAQPSVAAAAQGVAIGQQQYARRLTQPIAVSNSGVLSNLIRPIPVIRNQVAPVLPAATQPGSPAASTSASPASLLDDGSFTGDLGGWVKTHRPESVAATVVDRGTDAKLEVGVAASEGSVAKDLAVSVEPGRNYRASIRAVSQTGLPVLIELAVHSMNADGTIGETASRFAMVEGFDVPVTTTLTPTGSYPSLRAEVYLHTIDRPVLLDDVKVTVDGVHHGPSNYGYQQPRVRYLNDVDLTSLTAGELYEVEVSVGTTTDQPWFCCGSVGSIYLGAEDADLVGGSDRTSELHVPAGEGGSGWVAGNRIAFDRNESTIGGSFTTVIQAPTRPGPFAERFRLVAEGVTWIPGPVVEIIGSVEEPVAEAPGDDDPQSDLIIDCPPAVSIAKPDPTTSDCVGEIDGFAPKATDVGAGRFTLSWQRPAPVSVDFYLIEIQDLGLPAGPIREAEAVTLETGERSLLIESAPGRYTLRVLALDENGQWVRSPDVEIELVAPTPIKEVDLPPVGCPVGPVTGSGFPIPCTPIPGGDPTGPRPTPDVPGCEPVAVAFEDDFLMRYPGSDRSSIADVDLSCTSYYVDLLSSDPRHNVGYQPDQTGERWFLEGLNADGDVIYTSPTTPDLPADETNSTLRVGPVDLTDVVSFQAHHLGRGTSANSVVVAVRLTPTA